MATITASWTENITTVDFSDTSPADTVSSTASIDLAADGYDCIVAQVSWTFNASATDYIAIHVYADVNSGSNPDDIPLFSQRVSAENAAKEISIVIKDVPFVDIVFENQSNQEVTSLDLIYAGRKWASA
jgi:hypothetical protein